MTEEQHNFPGKETCCGDRDLRATLAERLAAEFRAKLRETSLHIEQIEELVRLVEKSKVTSRAILSALRVEEQ